MPSPVSSSPEAQCRRRRWGTSLPRSPRAPPSRRPLRSAGSRSPLFSQMAKRTIMNATALSVSPAKDLRQV
ncbi:hypothetical protein M6B38_339095 [Iris pallida]|uniref:Uncharacterized protein n=1 Tax=Iris pallida TaxID=29817 RepID=A0AAX6GZ72_IRIPA|nr:hypothetical protein M6B38_339095 [Iris pallida]